MATDTSFVDFISDQLSNAGEIRIKSMFGEYGTFCDDVFFGLICNNKLYIKPTEPGREFIGEPVEAPAYKGANPSFLIEDKLENSDWLCELVKVTVNALPPPRKKKQ